MVRLRTLAVDPLDAGALSRLGELSALTVRVRPERDEFLAMLEDAHVLVCRSGVVVDAGALAAAPHLRVIIRAGNGVDNIDLAAARARGVAVYRLPHASVNAVAEFVLALLFGLFRRVTEADRQVRAGVWRKGELVGQEVAGKTLGLIGCGNLGARIAALGQAVGMTTIATVARTTPERRASLAAIGVRLVSFTELLDSADAVSVQVPGGEATQGLVSAEAIGRLRPGAVLIDVSRAGVVDHGALLAALTSGRLSGAAADVHATENGVPLLSRHPRAVVTPHIGGSSAEAQLRIGHEVVQIVQAHTEGHVAAGFECLTCPPGEVGP